jgi:hypothetical protein
MGKWNPCKRRDFIRKLKNLGFGKPEPGGRHFFMRYGTYTFTLPNNTEYSVPQIKMLISELEKGIGREISSDEWKGL